MSVLGAALFVVVFLGLLGLGLGWAFFAAFFGSFFSALFGTQLSALFFRAFNVGGWLVRHWHAFATFTGRPTGTGAARTAGTTHSAFNITFDSHLRRHFRRGNGGNDLLEGSVN